ncbi:MAG: CinA family protein [Hyphomicrobiales bacterium]
MASPTIHSLAQTVIERFNANKMMVATAESCTGGLIAAALTEIAGSSSVLDRGYVTYSNEAKAEMLGVPTPLIVEHGAVSHPVAQAMAAGALKHSNADVAVAVTGIAGPSGGTDKKPVGLVYIATQRRGKDAVVSKELFGDIGREAVRQKTVIKGLEMLLGQLTP